MDFKEHEQRVIQERNELSEKTVKLSEFIDKSKIFESLGDRDRELLVSQYNVMLNYLRILNERIGRFVK